MQTSVVTCSLPFNDTEGVVNVYKVVIMSITMEESPATAVELQRNRHMPELALKTQIIQTWIPLTYMIAHPVSQLLRFKLRSSGSAQVSWVHPSVKRCGLNPSFYSLHTGHSHHDRNFILKYFY